MTGNETQTFINNLTEQLNNAPEGVDTSALAEALKALSEPPEERVKIWFLLDRSGSMEGLTEDVVGGFNQFVGDQAAKPGKARLTAIQFDGDDPFVSTTHIERLIDAQQTDPVDFIVCDGLPLGATGFGVSREGLERICDMKQENNTEIWGHLFTENPEFRSASLDETDPLLNRPDVRMTLDYPEDYDFFSAVIDGLTAAGCTTEFEQIMAFLDVHPEVVGINAGVAEKYEAHLAQSREPS